MTLLFSDALLKEIGEELKGGKEPQLLVQVYDDGKVSVASRPSPNPAVAWSPPVWGREA